jgi:hypothetical protein
MCVLFTRSPARCEPGLDEDFTSSRSIVESGTELAPAVRTGQVETLRLFDIAS